MSRVLIVDDNVEDAALLSRILKDAKYEVSSTSCPKAALSLAQTERFDVVLLDNRFDQSSIIGLSAIQGFINAAAAVIMMTAFGDSEIEKDAKMLGANAYLTKPVDSDILLRTIAQLVIKR